MAESAPSWSRSIACAASTTGGFDDGTDVNGVDVNFGDGTDVNGVDVNFDDGTGVNGVDVNVDDGEYSADGVACMLGSLRSSLFDAIALATWSGDSGSSGDASASSRAGERLVLNSRDARDLTAGNDDQECDDCRRYGAGCDQPRTAKLPPRRLHRGRVAADAPRPSVDSRISAKSFFRCAIGGPNRGHTPALGADRDSRPTDCVTPRNIPRVVGRCPVRVCVCVG